MTAQPARDATPPVGRLAPSPTGHLHVGHARSFLLAWWSARSRGGRVVLRLEDLDASRVRPEHVDACLRDLEWLGLDWDGPPLLQSADPAPFAAAVADLAARGLAYPCTCTRREVAAAAPHADDPNPGRYPGTCRDRWPTAAEAERATGRRPAWRFRLPPDAATVAFVDALRGPQGFDVDAEAGDFPITSRDGQPAYQLAVVVDDARQAVTEVLRGDDLLPSTARQLLLQRALALPHPRWLHVPLVVDDDGRRLAKRTEALALTSLRESAVDPRALVAWIARSAGLEAPERAAAAELVDAFDAARIPLEPVRFGAAELAALLATRS